MGKNCGCSCVCVGRAWCGLQKYKQSIKISKCISTKIDATFHVKASYPKTAEKCGIRQFVDRLL